jgi:hypothetical protein
MLSRYSLTILAVAIFAVSCRNATGAGTSTPARPALSVAATGSGTASAFVVRLKEVATSPDAGKEPPIARTAGYDRGRHPTLPSLPTARTHKLVSANTTPGTAPRIRPCTITAVPCPFDGLGQDCVNFSDCFAPDPNAAIGGGEIVEVANSRIEVRSMNGAVLCGGPVFFRHFLRVAAGADGSLIHARVQFDNLNQRFSFLVSINNPPDTATPALWVAASDSADACGQWHTYRLTFNGDPYPNGTMLDLPMLGQDTSNLLISTRNCLPHKDCFAQDGANFTVFGLPKGTIYAGQPVSFNTFTVQSLSAPVTNAGQPMIASDASFFLGALPSTGYLLYRLTNGGGQGASLTMTTISSPYDPPFRNANQPGTCVRIDPADSSGSIVSSPYFDGTSIWFTHEIDDGHVPSVRYGAVNPTQNTVATAYAMQSPTSDDFNPSLAVAITPRGETLFLNWAFTDTLAGTDTSDVLHSVAVGPPIADLLGGGTVYATGVASAGETEDPAYPSEFGRYSSVSIDPDNGDCVVATNEYFGPEGWRTRIAPLGNCSMVVAHP